MIKLARIFSDGIVLQRNMPIVIWGESDFDSQLTVKINNEAVGKFTIQNGQFFLTIPPQKEMENATVQIGDIVLENVDFGEVWLAVGQSNMEFEYEFASDKEPAAANDEHLRMYTVGRYSFEGERELKDKEWEPWDKWYTATNNNEQKFSAVGYAYAKKLREGGVPIGIINSSWGGTSASAWIYRKLMEKDSELKAYIDDFETFKESLNLDVFKKLKMSMRANNTNPVIEMANKAGMLQNTTHPIEFMKRFDENGDGMSALPKELFKENAKRPSDINKIFAWGPCNPNEPGALYDHMVQEFMGYSVKGVIYYQGESDEHRATVYDKLFSTLINSWRADWLSQNAAQTRLPFIFTQLAPFGIWGFSNGNEYTVLREKQEKVEAELDDVYMASISDVGNVFDIHPKEKMIVGNRLALLAEKNVYNKVVAADAPKGVKVIVNREKGKLEMKFDNVTDLYLKEQSDAEYNGFAVDTIMPEFLPCVLGGVNGLEVIADGTAVKLALCEVENDVLVVKSRELVGVNDIKVKFARTAFYQVNLYNEGGIPAIPFEV
ncbi:MAG: sialate O-acetylesterase [Lachnotalea sp.]